MIGDDEFKITEVSKDASLMQKLNQKISSSFINLGNTHLLFIIELELKHFNFIMIVGYGDVGLNILLNKD